MFKLKKRNLHGFLCLPALLPDAFRKVPCRPRHGSSRPIFQITRFGEISFCSIRRKNAYDLQSGRIIAPADRKHQINAVDVESSLLLPHLNKKGQL
jgi:hypothetical protein